MTKRSPFRYFKTSPKIIRLAAMLYVRLPLSLWNIEDLFHKHDVDVSHETVRLRWKRVGLIFASEIRLNRFSYMREYSNSKSHVDEVFSRVNDKGHCIRRNGATG